MFTFLWIIESSSLVSIFLITLLHGVRSEPMITPT